jgi:hypothetical protein
MSGALGRRLVVAAAVAAVLGAVAGGLFIVGGPSEGRVRRLDERRVQDLIAIRDSIAAYAQDHAALPASLTDVPYGLETRGVLRDPVTNQPYEYHVTGDKTFELCADFQRESDDGATEIYVDRFWTHKTGRTCFRPKIDVPAKPR